MLNTPTLFKDKIFVFCTKKLPNLKKKTELFSPRAKHPFPPICEPQKRQGGGVYHERDGSLLYLAISVEQIIVTLVLFLSCSMNEL